MYTPDFASSINQYSDFGDIANENWYQEKKEKRMDPLERTMS